MVRALALLPLLAGCPQGAVCVDRGDCGDLQVCDNGHCKDVSCATSEDCAIGQFCDTTGSFQCRDGCRGDDDCLSGETCDVDSHQCDPMECRTTALDCAIGEKCSDGECEDAMGKSCDPCNDPLYYDYWYGGWSGGTGCGGNGTCVWFTYYADAPWCMEQCNPNAGDEACPRGFECVDLTGENDFHCYAWCPSVDYEIHNQGD